MIEGSRPQVLTDAQWEVLAPLIAACRPPHKTEHHDLRRTIEAIIWRGDHLARRSSGGTIAARSGARSRLRWAPGGWQRRPSAAGRGWARGSDCWSWRSSVAGLRPGWVGGGASNPRRHRHPGAPQGRRRGEKGGTSAERDVREALGRSRGGYASKACVIADASGRALGFALAPGPAHELPLAPLLLTLLSFIPAWIVADRGYASHAFRDLIWNLGSGTLAPALRSRPSATKPTSPVPHGSTTTAIGSSVSGRGSKSGALSPPATRKRRAPSWGCSAWPPRWTGSSSQTELRN